MEENPSSMPRRLAICTLCLVGMASINSVVARAESTVPTYRAAKPSAGQSKTIVEPGAFGAVRVEPLTPTVVPLGLNRYMGVTASNVGSKQLSMNRIVLPPGARGPRNMHRNAEKVIMVLQGPFTTLMGEKGEKTIILKTGDFLYIPGNAWHQWVNPGKSHTSIIVEARADANDLSNVQVIATP
jgi:uncharacterized RmlC-like cupin family protein